MLPVEGQPPVGAIMVLTTEVTEDTENNKTARTWWSFLRDRCDLCGYIDRPLRPSKRIPAPDPNCMGRRRRRTRRRPQKPPRAEAAASSQRARF